MRVSIFELEFQSSPAPQACVDSLGRIIAANDAFAALVTRPLPELLGLHLDAVLSAAQMNELKRHRITRDDGLQVAARDEVASASDSDDMLDALVRVGGVRFWQADSEGVAIQSSSAAPPLPSGRMHQEDASGFDAAFSVARKSGEAFTATARWLRPAGGYEWELSRVVPLRLKDGSIRKWLGCSMPINELMLHQRSLTTQLKDSQQRLSELLSFASTLANEVRAPAEGLDEVAKMLLEDARYVDLGFTKKSLDLLVLRSRRLAQVVDNVIGFAQLESASDTERIKPAEVIEEVLRLLALGRSIRVDVIHPLPEPLFSVSAFQQVMTSLIGTAKRAGAKNVLIRGQSQANFACFEVDDDGPQVPLEQRAGLWELRHGDSAGSPRAGVALAMVRRLLERTGGTIELASSSPKGTVFSVRLPQ